MYNFRYTSLFFSRVYTESECLWGLSNKSRSIYTNTDISIFLFTLFLLLLLYSQTKTEFEKQQQNAEKSSTKLDTNAENKRKQVMILTNYTCQFCVLKRNRHQTQQDPWS